MKDSKFHFAIAIFWLALITFLLCIPGSEFPKATWLTKIWIDKWVHIFIFLVLVTAWCLAFSGIKDLKKRNRIFLQITIISLLYGIAMEVVQHFFVPFRGFEIGDIAADGLGCAGGYVFSTRRWIKNKS